MVATIADLLIDVYFAFRLIQHVRGKQSSTKDEKPYTFCHVRNALLVSIAFALHLSNIILSTEFVYPIIGFTIQTILFIILSCLVTYNVENSQSSSDLENEIKNHEHVHVTLRITTN
ncbi:2764_t:CDS:1 [Funneliformis caledonium]|uniref:2764_t:CDS:1 n=1 Tax=Funneliformis caledonium TaxID=1117310 RepID=A0A9N8ZPC5_9GLOM|nr:2764_t:CDS:1 [Funneliformis caledonium]